MTVTKINTVTITTVTTRAKEEEENKTIREQSIKTKQQQKIIKKHTTIKNKGKTYQALQLKPPTLPPQTRREQQNN